MANRTIYPLEVPQPPHWRGVSDLAGYVGDLFYGAYDRSVNFQVHNATAIAKRRGFVRALDEKFPGHPAGAFCREKGRPVQLIGDGVGVKILSSVPPIVGGGGDPFDDGDKGFLADNFDRADGTAVHEAGLEPWKEKGVHNHAAGSAWTATDQNVIKDRAWRVSVAGGTPTAGAINTGYLDKGWGANLPNSTHVVRVGLDLSNVPIAGDASHFSLATDYGKKSGATDFDDGWSHSFYVGLGLPGKTANTFNSSNENYDYGALNLTHLSHGDSHMACPWAGIGCRVQFRSTGDKDADIDQLRFAIRMQTFAYGSNYPEGHLSAGSSLNDYMEGKALGMDSYDIATPGGSDTQGIPALDDIYEITGLSYSQLQANHVLEFGRVPTDSGFLLKSRFFRGKNLSSATGSTTADIIQNQQFIWNEQIDDFYVVRPNEIMPSAGGIPTYGAMSASWLQPHNDVVVAANTHGIRVDEVQAHERFM